MNSHSQGTLRRVTQNDPLLTIINLVDNNYGVADGKFYSDNSDDYSALGAAIANNTCLAKLEVGLSDDLPLGVVDRGFYDGLKSNSSISDLYLQCKRHNLAGGVGHEILQVYHENNSQLTDISINMANLQLGGDRVIVDTLRSCRNLQTVVLSRNNITDEQLLPILEAVTGHGALEGLSFYENNIGNAGCEVIAALLTDPNCNLRYLNLGLNFIGSEGATIIANSLTNNNKLQFLNLEDNQIEQSLDDEFSNALCNTTSIGHTYGSNHTFETLSSSNPFVGYWHGQQLESLLKLNKDTNKSHVAMKKILQNRPNILTWNRYLSGMQKESKH